MKEKNTQNSMYPHYNPNNMFPQQVWKQTSVYENSVDLE